jgi:hypothetical protein
MRRISSEFTFFAKQLFPIGFGVLAVVLGQIFFFGTNSDSYTWWMILAAPLNFGFGYFITKLRVWDLADEVFDEGETLLVIKGKREERILLSDIADIRRHVNYTLPDMITLFLKAPSKFGQKITFFQQTQIPLVKNSS